MDWFNVCIRIFGCYIDKSSQTLSPIGKKSLRLEAKRPYNFYGNPKGNTPYKNRTAKDHRKNLRKFEPIICGFPASNLKRFCPTIYTLMENITINTNFAPIAFVISVLFFRVRFSLQWTTKVIVHFLYLIWYKRAQSELIWECPLYCY